MNLFTYFFFISGFNNQPEVNKSEVRLGYLFSPLEQKFLSINEKTGRGELADFPSIKFKITVKEVVSDSEIVSYLKLAEHEKTPTINKENKYLTFNDDSGNGAEFIIKLADYTKTKRYFQIKTADRAGCIAASYINPFYKEDCKRTPEEIWNLIYDDELAELRKNIKEGAP